MSAKLIKAVPAIALAVLAILILVQSAQAKSAVVGDILLRGTVERSGRQLANDSSLFEGDSLRTRKASHGVLRLGRGRVEITESSELEIVRGNPLKILVKSGAIAFHFPPNTAFEIVTPQLEVRPGLDLQSLSGVVTATPQTEDRVQSRSGKYEILERQPRGATRYIAAGQLLVATLLPTAPLSAVAPEPSPLPQGPLGGPQIAILSLVEGDVRVARLATPRNYARQPMPGLGLATGDFVATTNGQATVTFTDQSYITLRQGTTVQVQQQTEARGIVRRIFQAIGTLWFDIQRVAGTETTLETPTAVAAIRGTQGEQDVPNDTQSTHALNEGVEQITEVVTQQSVTIRAGQRVTAIRGVGFTPIVALLAAITQPTVGTGGAGGGVPGGGVGAAAAGGAAAGAAAATVATTTVSAVTSSIVIIATATLPVISGATGVFSRGDPPPASASIPLNPPGGR